jgi:hypothetical protein
MRAASTAAWVVRHVGGVGAQALLVFAIIVAILLALSPVYKPADFLAGTRDARAAAVKGDAWIHLDETARIAAPSLGSTVTFSTGYPKTVKNPRIEVLCSQDGSLVYGEAGGVDDTFLLGGGGSLWRDGGGAADCIANLYYFGWRAGTQTYNKLATTSFLAGG